MAETLRLEIITPQAIVVSEDVNMVTLPGVEGQLGIYPQHVRLITQIVPGEVIVNKDGHESSYAVGEGLVEIGPTHFAIVTDMAIHVDHIHELKVGAARGRAEAGLQEKVSDEEVASVNASLARSLAQLHVKRRRKM